MTSTARANSSSCNPLLVAMVDPTVQNDINGTQEIYTPVRLPCPKSGEKKDYLLLTLAGSKHHLLEIQCLSESIPSAPKQYQSWFVGNRVVANGNLYVLSRVDPLFWVLPRSLSSLSTQWQPMEQLLPTCPTLQKTLDPRQLAHLCDSYEMDEDEIFYKFSPTKTLQWLTKKQQAVCLVLEQQLVQAQLRQEQVRSNSGGAFAKDFNLTSITTTTDTEENETTNTTPPDSATPTPQPPTESMKQQAFTESIQIVCNYLSQEWETAFLKHLEQDASVLQAPQDTHSAKRIKSEVPIEAMVAAAVTPTPEPKKPEAPKLTFGQKQLLKVNKKGMKSMMSFFTVKKKE